MRMRWWVVSGVLWASAALAGERGFQFRASIDTGIAAQARLSSCTDSCNGSFSALEVGPMVALAITPGWRFGLVSLHGGAELQGTLLFNASRAVRVGPLLGIAFHIERWLVLSLDAKLLFPLLWDFGGAIGGNVRWGFELTRDGTHQLTASFGTYWVYGVMFTTSVGYVLTL
jgi:hypothetical protein